MKPLPGTTKHPLLGLFDQDPGGWRPFYYGEPISVPIAAGAVGTGTISLNNEPYILTGIAHKIIGDTGDSDNSGYVQDGQYDVEWRDEQSNYTDRAIPADLMWGTWGSALDGRGGGFVKELSYPIPYAGNKTLTFRITNRVARVFVPVATTFDVFICLHGINYWGELKRG